MAKRRKFTAKFKAEVVLEALTGESSQAELCRRYNLSENQVSTWKHQLLENVETLRAPSIINRGSTPLKTCCERKYGGYPTYGYRRIRALLLCQGYTVGYKRVARLMKEENLSVSVKRVCQTTRSLLLLNLLNCGLNKGWHFNLGKDKADRKMLIDEFKVIYNLRSKAVHNGKVPDKIRKGEGPTATPEFITRAQDLCRDSILKILEDGEFPDWNDLILG